MTKLAIIGCGKQAPKHIKGLKAASENLEIVVFDRDEAAAKSLSEQLDVARYLKIDDVMNDSEIHAVDICTPTRTHKDLILKALAANKDFFCEKPLCDTLDDAEVIAESIRRSEQIGMIGFVYRFAPAFEAAYNALQNKAMGDITTATFRIGGRGSHQVWKHRKETHGGALNEMMVHMLDLAIWYFGEVIDVEVLVSELYQPTRMINGKEEEVDAEDYLLVKARMECGIDIILQADMVTPAFSQYAEIQGTNGSFFGSIQPDRPSYFFLNEARGIWGQGRTDLNTDGSAMFSNQMGEFVKSVEARTQPARCSVEDSLKVMKAVELIKKKGDMS